MNVNPDSPQALDLDERAVADAAAADPAPATAPADKPVRRKRAVKAVPAAIDEAAQADAPLQQPLPLEAEGLAALSAAPDDESNRSAAVSAAAERRPPAAVGGSEAPRAAAAAGLVGEAAQATAESPLADAASPLAEAAAPADANAPAGADAGVVTLTEAALPAEPSRHRRDRQRPAGRADAGTSPVDDRSADDADAPFAAEAAPTSHTDADADAGADAEPAAPPADVGEVFANVLSGTFDTEVEAPADGSPALPPKRVLRPEPEAPKLHKVLAQAGIGSRREMEELILDGQISVNGQPAHIGQRISFGDQIQVKGKPVRVRITPPPPRVVAYHKPVGEVVTHDDPQARPTVFRRLPRLPQGKWQSVGRLDINTEGLLLFTNSGDLANRLMHPRFGVEREYAVRVLGTLDAEDKAMLLEGVTIDGQTAAFRSVVDGGGEGANHWYRVVIAEGRNREVRRLFDAVDLTVSRLIRIRYGSVVLPRGLKRGVWVDLDDTDIRAIRQLASAPNDGAQESRGKREGRDGPDNRPRRDRPTQQGQGQGPRQRPDAPRPERLLMAADGAPPRTPPSAEGGGPRVDERPPRNPDHDIDDDFDPSRIPNPLEQTFDKRFVQNPRTPAGGRGFRSGGGGFGAGGSAQQPSNMPQKRGELRQPDPMQTSVGYIGADAYHRKGNRSGGGGGSGGGNRGGGGQGGGNRGGNGGGAGGGQGGQGGWGGGRRGR